MEAWEAYQVALTYWKTEDARAFLPMAIATPIGVTANVRAWREIFEARALNPRAQWEIRAVLRALLDDLAETLPCLFGDLIERDS